MYWIWVLITGFMVFSFVIFFGAPFLPTHKKRLEDPFDLLQLKPGQTMLELGSGDGRMLALAAERGIRAIGYELNPFLVIYSKYRLRKYKGLARVHWRNYWWVKLPKTDGIYVFLLQRYMSKLNKKIEQDCSNPVKLVSYVFKIPNKKPIAEYKGMLLYKYN